MIIFLVRIETLNGSIWLLGNLYFSRNLTLKNYDSQVWYVINKKGFQDIMILGNQF